MFNLRLIAFVLLLVLIWSIFTKFKEYSSEPNTTPKGTTTTQKDTTTTPKDTTTTQKDTNTTQFTDLDNDLPELPPHAEMLVGIPSGLIRARSSATVIRLTEGGQAASASASVNTNELCRQSSGPCNIASATGTATPGQGQSEQTTPQVGVACCTPQPWTTSDTDFDHPGNDYRSLSLNSHEDCGIACLRDQPKCKSWSYNESTNQCSLKSAISAMVASPGTVTGQYVLPAQSSIDADVDHIGSDYMTKKSSSPEECSYSCISDQPKCKAWAFMPDTDQCYLKDNVPPMQVSKGNFTGQVKYPIQTPAQQDTYPEPIDTNSLYTIEDADDNFRLAIWGMTANGLANQNPVNMFQGMYSSCAGFDCAFRFVDQGNETYSIETADGSGRLAMWGKTANGGLQNKNPVFIYKGSQGTCAGVGTSQDCAFRLLPNPNGTWRLEAGDSSGRLAFWDKQNKWKGIYDNVDTRSTANQLPVFMFVGSQDSCPGNDCQFRLRKVGKVPPPAPIDPKALYSITDGLGTFKMVWSANPDGGSNQGVVAMYQEPVQNCQGSGAGGASPCSFRFVPRGDPGSQLYSIETADGSARLAMWGKTLQGGLRNKNPVALYAGLQETCLGTGPAQDCVFKVSTNTDGTWKIEAGDGSGRLAIWDLMSKWRPMYNDPQTRSQADGLAVSMCTCTQPQCSHDCDFQIIKVGMAPPITCQYTTTFSGCSNNSIYIQNCSGQYLLAATSPQGGRSTPTWTSQPSPACCFNLIDPPFGGSYPPNSYSLESVAFPNNYLRHSSFIMRLDPGYTQKNDDFVFQFQPSLNGQSGAFTMRPVQQAYNQSCFFGQGSALQFQNGTCPTNDPEFANAASFNVGTPRLKGSSLCKYTGTFTGCTGNSIYVQNCDGQYLLPVQGQWTPTWTAQPTSACCFNLVTPPFGGNYQPNSYSLESVAFPGYFLRHADFVLRLDTGYSQQNDDFVFQFVPGVGGEPNTFSLRPSQPQWNNSCLTSVGQNIQFQSGLSCPQTDLNANNSSSFNLGKSTLTPSALIAPPPPPPTIDTTALYSIGSADGNFILSVWGMTANGLSNANPIAMHQGSYGTCGGNGADCTFRFVSLGDGLYAIETADGAGRFAMWGKTSQGGLYNQNPVLIYAGTQATCNGTGAAQDCAFKILPNNDGTWRIEAGDGTGRLAFWNWTSQWKAVYENPQTRNQADDLPVFMYTGSQQNCNGNDCSFSLTKVSGAPKPYVAYTTPGVDCSGNNLPGNSSIINANPGETAAQLVARCSEACTNTNGCGGFSATNNVCIMKSKNCSTAPFGLTENGFTFYYNPETTSYIAFDPTSNQDCAGNNLAVAPLTQNSGESSSQMLERCNKTCDNTNGCQGHSFNGNTCFLKSVNCELNQYNRMQNGFYFYYKPQTS